MVNIPGRTACVIDLDAIIFNMEQMHENLPEGCGLMAVVKTDAYGHGVIPVARACAELPYLKGFAVATAEEAMELREAGIGLPVLVLGYVFPEDMEKLARADVRMAVFRRDQLDQISEIGEKLSKRVPIHLAVDTGMGRIGITPDDAGLSFVKHALSLPGICAEGMFTHFARADEEAGASFTAQQFRRFTDFVGRVERELDFRISVVHCANSASILLHPERGLDMARAGITMYGLAPSDEMLPLPMALKPALSWYSHIAFIKDVPAGTPVSYGSTYVTDGPRRIATVPVGYGDGYPRSLSGKGEVLIRGKRVPIVGRVCMDQLMVDLTEVPEARESDLVTLLGTDGAEKITAEELGGKSGRFNYELVCCISPRVPRVYTGEGR